MHIFITFDQPTKTLNEAMSQNTNAKPKPLIARIGFSGFNPLLNNGFCPGNKPQISETGRAMAFSFINLRFDLFIFLYFFAVNNLAAQANLITFGEKNWVYNPINTIMAGVKDDNGFVWFGSPAGLVRWDGLQSKIYVHDTNDSNSIPSGKLYVSKLFYNRREQTIWIPMQEGLCIFDPVTDNFTTYKNNPKDPGSLPDNATTIIYQDRQGIIWVGTNNGLAKFKGNVKQRTFESFYGDIECGFNFGFILDIQQDINNDSILWMGTMSGDLISFNKYSLKAKRHFENNKTILGTIRYVYPLSNNLIVIENWSNDIGMVVYDIKNEKTIKRMKDAKLPNPEYRIQSVRLNPILENEKRIWQNTNSGLCLLNPQTLDFELIKLPTDNRGRLIPLTPLFEEEGKQIWFGTDNGFAKEPIDPNLIENYFYKISSFKSYANFHVPGTKGMLIPGTKKILLPVRDENGLYVFDFESKKLEFLFDAIVSNPDYHIVRDILIDEKEGILLLTNKGLAKIDVKNQSFTWVYTKDVVDFGRILRDSRGIYWMLSFKDGLFKFDIKNRTEEKIELGDRAKSGKYFFKEFFTDKYDNIWIDYDIDQYGVYLREKGKFILFKGESIDGFRPSCFAEDNSRKIWVGNYFTEGADIGFIDPDNPEKGIQLKSWLTDILYGKEIKDIEFDDRERLWVITEKGLEVVDFLQKNCKLFNETHGLIMYDDFNYGNPANGGKLKKLPDGKMAIIYRGGIGLFHCDSLFNYKTDEKITPYITSVKIAGKQMVLDSSSVFKKHLILGYEDNDISLDYSIICQNGNDPFIFYHQLVGIDKDWVQSEKRLASYADLPPDQYYFKIKVMRGKKEVSTPFSFSLEILPPWYRTWWAYMLYGLAVIGLLLGIRRYELRRHLAHAEARRLKELDTVKSHLYTNITHEFRTPLTVILGMADQVKSDPKNWFNEGLNLIKRNGQQLLHLVNQLLDLAKLESGNMPVYYIHGDIVPFLKYLAESFHSYADSKDIRLHFLSEIAELSMDHDPEKLQNIVSNLVSNAIKFTPTGGDIYVVVKKDGSDKLVLSVTDTGEGISEKDLPHIFDRFYQVDSSATRRGEGTGIGLSLCKELVKLMGGGISVESGVGKGSRFTVTLPISHAHQSVQKVHQTNIPPSLAATILFGETKTEAPVDNLPNDKRPLVLLVEDNEDVITYLTSLLSANYEILTATDGQSGIDKAIEHIPDLIVSDVMMPQKDGFEVCETLKTDERTSHVPIILLTAKSDTVSRLEGLTHGADAYLAKPFHKEELLIRIEKLIALRHKLRERFSGQGILLKIAKSHSPTRDERFIKKLIEIVEAHLSNENFGMPELCKQAGMSRTQLFRKLKALTGKSATRFIRSIRLEKAKGLLETTDLSISEVAYQTGFGSAAYFSKTFQEEFGAAPSEVRKKHS